LQNECLQKETLDNLFLSPISTVDMRFIFPVYTAFVVSGIEVHNRSNKTVLSTERMLIMKVKKLFSIALAIMVIVSIASVPVNAVDINKAYPSNITGFILSTNNSTARAYSSVNGTAIGWIYYTDDARISEIYTNGWCKCTIPWDGYKNGRTVYTPISNFFAKMGTTVKTAIVKSPAYSRNNLSNRLGYCYVNDRCIILAESGNYYQCLCPWDNGTYRLCWIAKSAFASTSTSTTSVSSSLCWPCRSTYISTMYYYWNGGSPSRHATLSNRWNAFDIAGSSGESIFAVDAGKVISAGWSDGGFGYRVIIEHSNGLRSLYGHLKSAPLVSAGKTVAKGQLIGYMGNTGNSSGVHLHFEMYNPNNLSQVINPWTTYYQGKVNVTIGGNSLKASNVYKGSDSYAQNWVNWLNNNCKKNSTGDYVFTK